MATIALEYNASNQLAQKTDLERAFEDIEKGRVHRLITPSKKTA
jgi:hypothetical protein